MFNESSTATSAWLAKGLATGLIMVIATQAGATEGYFALGYAPNQRATGGAGVAHSGQSMSATVNPAAAANVGHEFQFGAALFSPSRGYQGTSTGFVPSGNVESGSPLFVIPNMSYNRPLADGGVMNFSIYGNGGMNTDYPDGLTGCGSVYCSGPAGVDLSQLYISATYANRIGNLSFGFSPTLAAQTFSARGLGAFAGISTDATALSNNGYDWSYGIGLRAGVQLDLSPSLRFGVSGQTKINMSKFDSYAGLFENGGDFDIPASVTAGFAWDARPDLTLMADYQHIFYSGVGAIGNAGNAGPLGAPGGAGFGWDDVGIVKFGVEWHQNDKMTWRAGYAHATNPVGPEDVTLNIIAPGIVTHHYTLGGSWAVNETNAVDFAVVYVPENTVTGPETTPAGPTGGTVRLKMSQMSFSAGWTHKF